MLLAHLNQTPQKPSERVSIPIPRSIEAVILQCLAKDRADRPKNAETLQQMLESCSDVTPWTSQDAEEWWRVNLPIGAEDAPTEAAGRDSYSTI